MLSSALWPTCKRGRRQTKQASMALDFERKAAKKNACFCMWRRPNDDQGLLSIDTAASRAPYVAVAQHARHGCHGIIGVGHAPGVGHQAVKLRRGDGDIRMTQRVGTRGREPTSAVTSAAFLRPALASHSACHPNLNPKSLLSSLGALPLPQTPCCPHGGCRSCSAQCGGAPRRRATHGGRSQRCTGWPARRPGCGEKK